MKKDVSVTDVRIVARTVGRATVPFPCAGKRVRQHDSGGQAVLHLSAGSLVERGDDKTDRCDESLRSRDLTTKRGVKPAGAERRRGWRGKQGKGEEQESEGREREEREEGSGGSWGSCRVAGGQEEGRGAQTPRKSPDGPRAEGLSLCGPRAQDALGRAQRVWRLAGRHAPGGPRDWLSHQRRCGEPGGEPPAHDTHPSPAALGHLVWSGCRETTARDV